MDLHPNRPASISMDLPQIQLVEFDQNSTGQIGCKSIEIMTTKFDWALITGQIG